MTSAKMMLYPALPYSAAIWSACQRSWDFSLILLSLSEIAAFANLSAV